MENVKNDKKIILIIILVLLLFAGMVLYNYINKEESNDLVNYENTSYQLLNDYSRFFTVNSCVYKYVQYLQKEDFESLFQVLDKKYVEDNGINQNNIYRFLPNLSNGIYSYVSKKIYYEEIGKNYITYYVNGYVIQDTMDSSSEKQYYSFIVNLDTKNEIFSIAPYTGNIFKEES